MQTLQTEPSLVKVSLPLCPFLFHAPDMKALRRTHRESFVPPTAFRFPCCGRTYPCDVCHDENQDHPMELATRMICGYCAKEQVSYHILARELILLFRLTYTQQRRDYYGFFVKCCVVLNSESIYQVFPCIFIVYTCCM